MAPGNKHRESRDARSVGASLLRIAVVGSAVIFMLWPYVLVAYQAVNDSVSFPAPFRGVTGRWFVTLWEYNPFRDALWTSLSVGISAAGLSLAVSTPAALAVARGPRALRSSAVAAIMSAPIIVPQIAIGLAILLAAATLGVPLGRTALIWGHAVLITPFVVRSMIPAAAQVPPALEHVGSTLGASRLVVLRSITMPLLRPGLIAASVVAFLLSFINLPVSLFLVSGGERTLPIEIFNYMTSRIDPLVAALSTALMVISVVGGLLALRVFRIRLF